MVILYTVQLMPAINIRWMEEGQCGSTVFIIDSYETRVFYYRFSGVNRDWFFVVMK